MQTTCKLLFFLGLIGLVFPTIEAKTIGPKDVVISVGKRKITKAEFDKRYQDMRSKALNPPSKMVFAEDLIRYEVGLAEAEKRGLRQDPIVRDRVNQEMYRVFVENSIGESVQNITIEEKDMRAYYKKNPEIRTSHILIEVRPDATKQQRKLGRQRAKEILAEVLRSKRSFENLVKLYSDDSMTKAQQGDAGWQNRINVVPNYYNAARKIKVGQISRELVETPFGFHVIKLTGIRPFADANKTQIRAAVFDEKRLGLFNQLFSGLKGKYRIKLESKAFE